MCNTSVFRWVVSSGLVFALMLVGLNPVAGQTTKRSGSSQEVRRLSLVIGGGVRIADGVSVGTIEDVVLNDRGCIDYVVVVYQDRYVAIPWSVATVDYVERIVTVDITERRFAEAPTFARTEFSMLARPDFTQRVRSAFGGKGESTSVKVGAKAESSKATKSEAQPGSAKVGAQDQPKSESKNKPKDQSVDTAKDEPKTPKAASKEKAKDQPLDKAKDEPKKSKAESKAKRKGSPGDKPTGEVKDKSTN